LFRCTDAAAINKGVIWDAIGTVVCILTCQTSWRTIKATVVTLILFRCTGTAAIIKGVIWDTIGTVIWTWAIYTMIYLGTWLAF
jgi:hypothetical protein